MPRRRISRSLLLPLSLIAALAAASGLGFAAGRFEYRVVGIAPSDALNVRDRPDSQKRIGATKVVGRIPPNAGTVLGTGATLKLGTARWFEVHHGNVRGWVNGRYLASTGPVGPELDADLVCSGAEPFWSLKIERDGAEFKSADGAAERYTIAAREPFQGRRDMLAIKVVSDRGSISALVQHKEWCSNGASDVEYAFEVRVVGIGGSDKPLKGCCMLQR